MANLAMTKAKVAAADAQQGTGGMMTKKVDTAVKMMLSKQVNPNQIWGCYDLIDRSGSMDGEYRKGNVQDAVERSLAFALIVDDDGSVPTAFFDSRVEEFEVKLDDFHNFIDRNRISARGTTNLAGALEWVARATGNADVLSSGGGGGFFRSKGGSAPTIKKMAVPAFVTCVTDGVPDDPEAATDIIRRLSYRGVFLKFLFVGNDPRGWAYLESLDDDIPVGVPFEKGGRLIDNVDAKRMSSLGKDDEAFYDAMFDEVTSYLAAARQHGLI